MQDEPLDKLQRPIHPGDFIVYGHALGRCAALRVGRVLAINEKPVRFGYESKWRLTVIGVNDDSGADGAKLLSKKSTLMFPDRCLVLVPDFLPDKYRDMMEDYDRSPATE